MKRTLSQWQAEVHGLAKAKGWWPDGVDLRKLIVEKLLLIHSEVSEATESYRANEPDLHSIDGKPSGLASELADVVIRALDLAGALGIDLEQVVSIKHGYNKTRSTRHGNKVI